MSGARNQKSSIQWRCELCAKFLSSKRSYREHMNVHNRERPFQCDKCDYASASQMTLRRHRLRSHIARTDWGYPCPYCSETYMEPASYQQHVSHRHFGNSCTFGCPHESCNFTSKSSKYFLEHVTKHLVIIRPGTDINKPFEDDKMVDATRFLIDDEVGTGYGKPPLPALIRRCDDVLQYAKPPKTPRLATISKPKPATRAIISRKAKRRRPVAPKSVSPSVEETSDEGTTLKKHRQHIPDETVQEEYQEVYYDYPDLLSAPEMSYVEMSEDIEGDHDPSAEYELVEESELVQYIHGEDDHVYYENGDLEEYHDDDNDIDQEIQNMLHAEMSKTHLPDGQIDIELD